MTPSSAHRQDAASRRTAALDTQRRYYETRRPTRMLAEDTPYIRRHFDAVWQAGRLSAGERICEWGGGLGRFSRKLAGAGLHVDVIELSPTQAADCERALSGFDAVRVRCGDIIEVLEAEDRRYDAMVGFFLLHHLERIDDYFAAAWSQLRDGGRIAFTEPNPANPLYPLQITLTPGMRWHAERGIYRLWPSLIRAAAQRAGFSRVDIAYYGALPRAPYNLMARLGAERLPEWLLPPRLRPFQTIVAWR